MANRYLPILPLLRGFGAGLPDGRGEELMGEGRGELRLGVGGREGPGEFITMIIVCS